MQNGTCLSVASSLCLFIATAAFAIDPSEPLDEAMGGKTLKGTPVKRRLPECFPAEPRDVFSEMDKVVGGPGASPGPLNFDADGDHKISDKERDGIRGRNTWLLWGGGNEEFWGWLQEEGYGLNDFLILLDSRNRDHRFRDAGLINQPGFVSNSDSGKSICGLFLDLPNGEKVKLVPPATDLDENGQPAKRKEFFGPGTDHRAYGPPPRNGETQSCNACHVAAGKAGDRLLFEPGDKENFEKVKSQLADDGLDPTVYGYASGIFGLRLMPNPDFFGKTPEAKKAREYWRQQVENDPSHRYYTDYAVQADPRLVRPFRVSMSCGFCHVGPHPLNPPKDPEHPEWANLSSIIGDQYWSPQAAFANLLKTGKQKEEKDSAHPKGQPGNFLHHFLASQQPGTIDTSLVSTDWINNSNTINAVFDVPARLTRAMSNQPEKQSAANLLIPSVEEKDASVNPRHFPRVLVDGSDSCGVFTALIRVPLNIGTYFEEWKRTSNPIIGFARRRLFSVAVCQANSVYWQTNERYRVPYEKEFFSYQNVAHTQISTAAMKLRDAPGGPALIDPGQATAGRAVFIQHCAICHSSKQPDDFQLTFSRNWEERANFPNPELTPTPAPPPHYTLPMVFAYWDAFKKSAAYADYVARVQKIAGNLPDNGEDPFIKDNFLSSEVRIPVSLVGTNSARATATNALRGEVWDNFSSDEYKDLKPVGPLRFFNPFSGATPDDYGNNDSYSPGGGGRGYYRPASLISLWATAPYLHNNSLGLYNHDPSVTGRLAAFQDGIEKLLWKNLRARDSSPEAINPPEVAVHLGDLRLDKTLAAAHADPGYIYRVTEDTEIFMAPGFIRPLLVGILGPFLTNTLALWVWIVLAVVFLIATFPGNPRHVTFLFIVLALAAAALLAMTGLASVLGRWLWLAPVALFLLAWVFYFLNDPSRSSFARVASRIVLLLATLTTIVIGFVAHQFVNGEMGPLRLGPIPRGTPVNLIMNMDPDNPNLVQGLIGLTRGVLRARNSSLNEDQRYAAFISEAADPMMRASKCPDFVLDRGHYFGEGLTDQEKRSLIAFLKTL